MAKDTNPIKDQALKFLFDHAPKIRIDTGDTIVVMEAHTKTQLVLRPVTVDGIRYKAAFDGQTLYYRQLSIAEDDPEQPKLIDPGQTVE